MKVKALAPPVLQHVLPVTDYIAPNGMRFGGSRLLYLDEQGKPQWISNALASISVPVSNDHIHS